MWYKSLRNNIQPKLTYISGRWKKPVKLLYPDIKLPYHNYSFSLISLAKWKCTTFRSFHVGSLLTTYSHPTYRFVEPHPFIPVTSQFSKLRFFVNGDYFESRERFVPAVWVARWTTFQKMWMFAASKTFMKLKFRGKGYYLYRSKRNALSFRFGYSHRVYRFPGAVWYKMVSKTEVFLWGRVYASLWKFAWTVKKIRPHNQYTGKGIRFVRQITYRKLGKVGSYR
jgi:hypothetical protein